MNPKFDIAVLNMNVKEEKICRLCLGVAENDYQLIDEITKQILEVILSRVNLDVSNEPIICKDCTEISIKCFNFKSACMDTEKLNQFYTRDKNRATFESKDVYNNDESLATTDDMFVCRFCWCHSSRHNFDLLPTLKNDVSFTEKFQALMPGLDFNVIKNLVICPSCRRDLEFYIKFVENCWDVEEKITKYRQNEGTASRDKVKLSDVLRFWSSNIFKLDNYQTHVIKKEENTLEDIGEAHSEVYDGELIKHEDIDFKDEDDNFDETECKGVIDKEKNSFINTKNVSETNLFKCSICNYETKRNSSLKRHILIHKHVKDTTMFKCSVCTFMTQHKDKLKKHTLIHKHVTEIVMYKCSTCTFQTKHKRNLKAHALTHKDVTEIELYKCSICTHETKRKGGLKMHMLIHKNVTEVDMYKCPKCTYETRHKGCFKNHTLTHRDVTDVKMHKCPTCPFETKHKHYMKTHNMLTHKDVKEVEMYECSTCTFVTKHKGNLKKHTLIHKDVTEVEMYKCSMCRYETKRKRNLKGHMLIHKEVEMYKCSICAYETKHKSDLKRHIKRHELKSLKACSGGGFSKEAH